MHIGDRVYSEMSAKGWSEGELARQAGVTQPTVHRIITGESKAPKRDNVERIAKALKVSSKWLWDGIVEKSPESNLAATDQPRLSYRYPVISWVSAGSWQEAVQPYPDGYSDTYEFSEYDSKGPAFWLKVKGDSMTAASGQTIAEGTLILVDTEAEAAPGKLVVAKLPDSNEATFKKLVSDGGRLYLKPLNSAYPTEAFGENCRIVGVVVQALQKFY